MKEGMEEFVRKIRLSLTVLIWLIGVAGFALLAYSIVRGWVDKEFQKEFMDGLFLSLAVFLVPMGALAFLRWLLPGGKRQQEPPE
jgi:hypothetical protein